MVKMTSPSTKGKNITYNKTLFEASTYNWVDLKKQNLLKLFWNDVLSIINYNVWWECLDVSVRYKTSIGEAVLLSKSRRWLTCINNILRRNVLKKMRNFTFDHDEHFRKTNKHIPTHWSISWYSMIYRSQELSCVIQPGAAWSSLAVNHGSIKRWKGSVKN